MKIMTIVETRPEIKKPDYFLNAAGKNAAETIRNVISKSDTVMGKERVLESIDIVISQYDDSKRQFRIIPDYNVDNVSKKVVRIIVSYTDYVNRSVWHKY